MGARLPTRVPPHGGAARTVAERAVPGLYRDGDAARSAGHHRAAAPAAATRPRRHVRPPRADLPRAAAPEPDVAGGGGDRSAREQRCDRVLHRAQGHGEARERAAAARHRGARVSRRARRARTHEDQQRLPRREAARRLRDGRVRHGHRPQRRAARRARGDAEEPRALPAGDRARGSRRAAGRVPAALLQRRRREVAHGDAAQQRRARW